MIENECKWAVAGFRRGTKRKGHHPRDPARPAFDEPTAGLPGTNEGQELGNEVEEEALKKHGAHRYEEQESRDASAGASSSAPLE